MKKRILLSDDDAVVREMVGRVLELEGYEMDYACTGREAISKFLAHPADLVLLDLNMPEGEGWEAYGSINSAYPLVPVIVITARPEQFRLAATFGIDGLMEKPLNLPLLLLAIQNFLSQTEPDRVRRLISSHPKTLFLQQNSEDHPGEIFQ